MIRYISIILLIGSFILPVNAQNSVNDILKQIEHNNIQLKANEQSLRASTWDSKSENNLENPSLSYSKVWDSKESSEYDVEFTATQSFDFPTTYISKNRVIKNKIRGLEAYYAAQRQEVLLTAKEVCLDIIKLNQSKSVVEKRLNTAEELLKGYQSMMAAGNVTKMDFNKMKLDVFNQKTQFTIIESELKKCISELQELNGNVYLDVSQLNKYSDSNLLPEYDLLTAEIAQSSYEIQQSKYDYESAKKMVAANKSGWLPGFELGYKRTEAPGRHSNGLVVGMSIPLFNNRGKVTSAKANAISKLYEQDIIKNKILSNSYQAYQEALAASKQIAEYEGLIDIDASIETLYKALKGGEISLTDYFVEMGMMYESAQNYIELNNLLQKQLAKLYKHRL